MYKCRLSVICLSHYNLRDNISDCPFNDDEHFSQLEQDLDIHATCPTNCSCLLFSLFCKQLTLNEQSNLKSYFAIYLLNVEFLKDSVFFNKFNDPVFLTVKHSKLSSICIQTKQLKSTVNFDISHNTVGTLYNDCFAFIYNVKFVNISFNRIHSIESYVFASSQHVVAIDVSWNKITQLNDYIFTGLSLKTINISGNPIISVSILSFTRVKISHIITQNFKVCCVKPLSNTLCAATPLWPNSCTRLLDDTFVKILIWLVNIIGLVMSGLSLITIRRNMVSSGESYNQLVVCLSISDILCCISHLIIVIAESIFRENYLEYEYYWRSDIFCISSSITSLISNYLSVFTINLLALTRYFVTKNPLDSIFLDKHFLAKTCMVASSLIVLLSMSLILSYIFTSHDHQLPTGLCSLLGHGNKSVISLVVTCITLLSQTVSFFIITITYHLLLRNIAEAKAAVQPITQPVNTGLNKSIFVAFTNLLSWLPSSILLCMTLFWPGYPYVLLIWTTMILQPLNTIIDPLIFVFFQILKEFVK